MNDYQWRSSEPVLRPPRPKLLLNDLQFIIFWALTNAIGLALGFFIGIGLAGGAPNETIIAGAIISAIVIGWIEMLLLTLQRVQVRWWWIVNTTVAMFTWGAAYPVYQAVGIWSGLIMGLLLGMFQYLNLRNRVERAGLWLVANLIGWGVALALFPWLLSFMELMLVWAVCGLSGGAITGWVMSRLVHHPQWEVDEAPLRDDYQS
ncbi:MAG: hypothetical protein HGB05_00460 [Chloroflexi bacterium]|nr:hypothetical protein [Chloroflexota bacterium]